MKFFSCLLFVLLLAGCWFRNETIDLAGEAQFRISYNNNRELTEAELDSLENSKPTYSGPGADNRLYDILVKKGIVSNNQLDTSGLGFKLLNAETPHIHFPEMDVNFEVDTTLGYDLINIKKGSDTFKFTLGETLLGDRWVCLFDSNDNGRLELLILEKYYITGGYNFDLKHYSF